jgi:aryl-alcohol dehydrogenase-like predicted oxidoreductase
VFDALEDLRAAGKLAHYGVSVERVEEALKAIEYRGVETAQIIFDPVPAASRRTVLRGGPAP